MSELATDGRFCESCCCRELPAEFIVRTGALEAPAAGEVRAITARSCTDDGGLATFE
jgi:hypothetical protein